jgi:peroxiredoxin
MPFCSRRTLSLPNMRLERIDRRGQTNKIVCFAYPGQDAPAQCCTKEISSFLPTKEVKAARCAGRFPLR